MKTTEQKKEFSELAAFCYREYLEQKRRKKYKIAGWSNDEIKFLKGRIIEHLINGEFKNISQALKFRTELKNIEKC